MADFQCRRCGWCCRNIVINVSYSDIIQWFNQDRNNVLREVSYVDNYPKKGVGGFYIVKTAFNPKQSCPFLTTENGLSACSIYDIRPVACRDFPYGRNVKSVTAEHCGMCPEKGHVFDVKTRRKVKRRQYKDFKMAHDNKIQLLKILVEARKRT